MKKIILSSLLISVLFGSSCSLYWDSMIEPGFRVHHIIFQIEPDDAQILLNGRFIGEAFEFSSPESALKLKSRNHGIIIKKKGYIEEVIDLDQYPTRYITIRLTMNKDKSYVPEKKEEKPAIEKKKPEYIAKTEPIKKPIQVTPPDEQTPKHMVNIRFEIQPADSAIYINGKFWGIVPESGKIENLHLTTGTYTIHIIKPNHESVKKVITVKDQKQISITVKLEKK
ncbi:MAG: PEGA domain-containing protein [Candidatus Aminicenantes bacterium]|nr:PEGA domain-containing protein [Candidatus Aminicenantes bacterium]